MAKAKRTEKKSIINLRHPVFAQMVALWSKWRLCYLGGQDFKDAFLEKYSKREKNDDWLLRKKLTYIPGHARTVINIIRNAIASVLPDVIRTGSPEYMEAMSTNVDLFNNAMSTFVALDIVPMLLVQGKRVIVVDAPPVQEGVTKAEDEGEPWFFPVDAEDVLTWSYGEDGNFNAILLQLWEDIVDQKTGLVTGARRIFRYMKLLEPEEEIVSKTCGTFVGPGVFVEVLDESGKTIDSCQILPIPRIPVVEFSLVASLMGEIADHQIALLNLASTDMDFLWRGNFPIYTEMQGKGVGSIKPRGTKASRKMSTTVDSDLGPSEAGGRDPGAGENQQQRATGSGRGIGYREGLERPAFINPATDNLQASMQKQDALAKEIRVLVDLALVSLSVKALEQSGKSKQADRIGEEAALAYIARVLEGGERDLNEIWHMMAGIDNAKMTVQYPTNFSLKTMDERIEEASGLLKLQTAVNSETYYKEVTKRVADIILRPVLSNERMEKVIEDIDAAPYFDADKTRSEITQKDSVLGLVSKETGSQFRGYDEEEAARTEDERNRSVERLAGAGGEGPPGSIDPDEQQTGPGAGGDGQAGVPAGSTGAAGDGDV